MGVDPNPMLNAMPNPMPNPMLNPMPDPMPNPMPNPMPILVKIKAVATGHASAVHCLLATNAFDPWDREESVDDKGRSLGDLAHGCNHNLEVWIWDHLHIGRWLRK